MIKDSQICHYINLIRRLHRQKAQNQQPHSPQLQVPPRQKTSPNNKNSLRFNFKHKIKKQGSAQCPCSTAHVSQVELGCQPFNLKKQTVYDKYFLGIRKKHQTEQHSMHFSPSFKVRVRSSKKLFKPNYVEEVVQTPKDTKFHKQKVQDSWKIKKSHKRTLFNNSANLTQLQLKKWEFGKNRIKTQTSTFLKIKKQQKEKTMKNLNSKPQMDFPLKIDGWEREVETELIDLFE